MYQILNQDQQCKSYQSLINDECNENYCQHKSFDENDQITTLNILYYILQWIVVGFSSVVGLGGDIQKNSISMGLLKYFEYEATNISYYISLGSSIPLLLYIGFTQKMHLVDFDIVDLIFPSIIISTDLGNFWNRKIPDNISVIFIMAVQLIMIPFIFKRFLKLKNREQKKKQQQQLQQEYDDILDSRHQFTNSDCQIISELYSQKQKQSCYKIIRIFICLIILQTVAFSRGGNMISLFGIQYSDFVYWFLSSIIYLISVLILIFNKCYLDKSYNNRKQKEDPNFMKMRTKKMGLFIMFIGFLACFSNGVIGQGGGLFMVPFFLLIENMKIQPKSVICTVIFCQFLISISTVLQTQINFTMPKMQDQIFFFFIGFSSFALTYVLIQLTKQDQYFAIIVFGLFLFDFLISLYSIIFEDGDYYLKSSVWDCTKQKEQ